MFHRLTWPMVGALLLAAVPGASLQATQRPVARTLRGVVVDLSTGAEIFKARIEIDDRRQLLTDVHGQFAVSDLTAAAHVVRVSAIGYQPVVDTIDLRAGDRTVRIRLRPTTVELAALEATADVNQSPTTQAVTHLDADRLAQHRGQTLGESLQDAPGVTVIQYGPSIAKPVVRGLHSARVQVMNGDVPQEGQQWGTEHAPEIDGFQAHEVEVIRGAAGILYGSNAIGGVVRVLPPPLPTEPGLAGELQVNGFSNNRQGAVSLELENAGLDLPLLGNVSWRLQGTLRGAGDASTPHYYLPNTGFTEANWTADAGMSRSWGSSRVSFSHFGTHLGMYRGAHVGTVEDLERAMADPLTADAFSREIGRPDQRVTHDLVTWDSRLLLGEATALELTYGYQYNNRNEFDSKGFGASSPRPAFGLRLITHSVEARLQHALTPSVHGTVGMVGIRQGNLSRGRSFLIPQYRLYSGGIYALEQYQRGPLSLTAGVRFDTRYQHVYQYGAPIVISPDEVHRWNGVSASFGAAWSPRPEWTLATSLGRMWRPANVNERFSQGVHHGTAQYEIGDPTLDRERSLAMDVTLRHQSERLRLELTAYRNQIDGFIYLRPRAPIQTVRGAYPAYQYTGTDALMTGGEASLQYEPTTHLMLYASGTLVRGTDRLIDQPLFDMPADRLVASVRLHGDGAGRVLGPYIELGTTLVRRQDRIPAATVYPLPADGYALFDAEVGVAALHLAGRDVELGLTLRNVFNTTHRDYLSRYRLYVDDQGRDLVFRLRTRFGAAR